MGMRVYRGCIALHDKHTSSPGKPPNREKSQSGQVRRTRVEGNKNHRDYNVSVVLHINALSGSETPIERKWLFIFFLVILFFSVLEIFETIGVERQQFETVEVFGK